MKRPAVIWNNVPGIHKAAGLFVVRSECKPVAADADVGHPKSVRFADGCFIFTYNQSLFD